MSDQAEHYTEFAFGADAPDWGPAFWQDYEGFVNPFEAFADAWDQFRGMGYTDLQALHDRLKERSNSAGKKRRVLAAELTSGKDQTRYIEEIEHPEIRFLSNARRYFWQRSKAAGALARYIEEKGPPPKWSKLSLPDWIAALEPGDLSDGAEKVLRVAHEYLKGRTEKLLNRLQKRELWQRVAEMGAEQYEEFPDNPGETLHNQLRQRGISPPSIERYRDAGAAINEKSTD